MVGEPQELGKDGERAGVVGLQLQGEVDALAGLGVVEAGEVNGGAGTVERVRTSWAGPWAGR